MEQTQESNGKTPKKIEKNDMTEIGLIAVYLVQKLGKPTLNEIHEAGVKKLGCKIHKRRLERALKAASRLGFIAVLQDRMADEAGTVVNVYAVKDLGRWKNAPEYVHVNALLPTLLETPEGAKIKEFFDKGEGTKAGSSKATRGNVVDDYYAFRVTVKNLDPLLGSQIHCPYTDAARKHIAQPTVVAKTDDKGKVTGTAEKKATSDMPEIEGIFVVDELTGEYILPSDVVQGWFATNAARYAGLPEARAAYVAFSPVRIKPKQPTMQLVLPVNNTRTGASAPKSYEAIRAGEEFVISFMAPTKGALSPEQWEKLFVLAGIRPRRGLSPARGKRYGRFLVTKFENLGPVKKSPLDFLVDDVPQSVLDEDGGYLLEALDRLKAVPLSGKFSGTDDADPKEPFPGTEADAADDD